jgi:hypothetical protein
MSFLQGWVSLFLQEHLNVILEDLDVSSRGRTLGSSNMTEQLADKEKELQYTPKNKKTNDRAYFTYERQ